MRFFQKAEYLYLNTEGNVSYHLKDNGKIYMCETEQSGDNKIILKTVATVITLVAVRLMAKYIPYEFIYNNIIMVVLGLAAIGMIAGVIFIEVIKEDGFKSFSEDKAIEKNEEIIRYHFHNGLKSRLKAKLFMYGWLVGCIVYSTAIMCGYRVESLWVLIPLMWFLNVVFLYVGRFYASKRKVEKIIKM